MRPTEQTLFTPARTGWDPWPAWHLVTVMAGFSSLPLMCQRLTPADIYAPGSSAPSPPIGHSPVSPVLMGLILVAMPTATVTREPVSSCFLRLASEFALQSAHTLVSPAWKTQWQQQHCCRIPLPLPLIWMLLYILEICSIFMSQQHSRQHTSIS